MGYHFYLFECLLKWDKTQVRKSREEAQSKHVRADTVPKAFKILSTYNSFVLVIFLLFLEDFESWVLHSIVRLLCEQNANVFQPHKEISKGCQAMGRPAYHVTRRSPWDLKIAPEGRNPSGQVIHLFLRLTW